MCGCARYRAPEVLLQSSIYGAAVGKFKFVTHFKHKRFLTYSNLHFICCGLVVKTTYFLLMNGFPFIDDVVFTEATSFMILEFED